MNADNSSLRQDKPAAPDKRRCLVIDIGKHRLVVPRVLVVEIIDRDSLTLRAGAHRDIQLFQWRGVEVPLIASRVIDPDHVQDREAPEKVVIFHGLSRPHELPFYAMETGQNPRLVSVAEQDIIEISNQIKLSKAEQMCVDINGEPAVIPRVDFLEGYVREATAEAARQSRQ